MINFLNSGNFLNIALLFRNNKRGAKLYNLALFALRKENIWGSNSWIIKEYKLKKLGFDFMGYNLIIPMVSFLPFNCS